LLLDRHDGAGSDDVARDVHFLPVHADVPVADELVRLRARAGEAEPVDDVVETALEKREQVLARDAAHALGRLERQPELPLENSVEALQLLLLAELDAVAEDLGPALAVLAGREIAALDGALVREAAVSLEEQLHAFTPAQPADGFAITSHGQTLLRLRGRQPLWGMGVASRMERMSMPAAARARMALSRPAPGPFTRTSSERTPLSWAIWAALPAASCAAKGVPLREPLKPMRPADDQARTLPCWSVIETIVLLKDACTVASACGMFFLSFFGPFFLPLPAGFAVAEASVGVAIFFLLVRRHGGTALRFPRRPLLTSSSPSSYRPRRPCEAPSAYGRSCGCAGRGRAGSGGAGRRDNSRSP